MSDAVISTTTLPEGAMPPGSPAPGAAATEDAAALAILRGKLAAKICKVMDEIEPAPKTGRNKDQHYSYVSARDIVSVTRKTMAKNRVRLKWVPSTTITWREYMSRSNNLQREATIWYAAVFVDAETGYEETIPWPGVGVDAQDKSLAKAATAAMKSFLATQFQVGDDGTDNDADEDAPRQARGARREQENKGPWKFSGVLVEMDVHDRGTALVIKPADRDAVRLWVRSTTAELQLAGAKGKPVEVEWQEGERPAKDGKPPEKFSEVVRILKVDGKTPPALPTGAKTTTPAPAASAQAKPEPGGVAKGTPASAVAPGPLQAQETVSPAHRPASVPSTTSHFPPSNERAKQEENPDAEPDDEEMTPFERELEEPPAAVQPTSADLFPPSTRGRW